MSLNASIKQAMIRAESGDRQGAGFAGSFLLAGFLCGLRAFA